MILTNKQLKQIIQEELQFVLMEKRQLLTENAINDAAQEIIALTDQKDDPTNEALGMFMAGLIAALPKIIEKAIVPASTWLLETYGKMKRKDDPLAWLGPTARERDVKTFIHDLAHKGHKLHEKFMAMMRPIAVAINFAYKKITKENLEEKTMQKIQETLWMVVVGFLLQQAGAGALKAWAGKQFGWVAAEGYLAWVKSSEIFEWAVEQIKPILDLAKDFVSSGAGMVQPSR